MGVVLLLGKTEEKKKLGKRRAGQRFLPLRKGNGPSLGFGRCHPANHKRSLAFHEAIPHLQKTKPKSVRPCLPGIYGANWCRET